MIDTAATVELHRGDALLDGALANELAHERGGLLVGAHLSGCAELGVEGHYGAGRVLIKPAIEGTGVIAGGPVRPLFELAGITNVLSKSLGTDNAMNIIKAAAEGLKELSSPQETAERRGITVSEMFVGKEN